MQDMKLINYGIVGIILLADLCACATAQGTQEPGRRGEWLSWTPVQRNAYVYGLVDGYLMGFARACHLADQLFEIGKPQRLGNDPSARCIAHRGEFSKISLDKGGHVDVSAYTDVVTAFYKDHPSCRDFPFALLLQSLSSKYATGDQLYEMAMKGGLEGYELRSRQWCTSGDSQAPKP
ncbi:MAG: hypothetical protein ACLPLR_02965 [Terriglobales bacterium]